MKMFFVFRQSWTRYGRKNIRNDRQGETDHCSALGPTISSTLHIFFFKILLNKKILAHRNKKDISMRNICEFMLVSAVATINVVLTE